MLHPFTKENAAEMARRAVKAREERRANRKAMAQAIRLESSVDNPDARTRRVLKQIKQCDDMLEDCGDPDTFAKLTASKERLWNLVFPKAGVMRPRQSGRRGGGPASLPPPVPE